TPSAVLFLLATSVAGFHQVFNNYLDHVHKNKNLLASSYSAELALGMLYVGAGGETAQELGSALNVTGREDVKEKYRAMLSSLPYPIEIANNLLVSNEYKVKEAYKAEVGLNFGATTGTLDMTDPKEAAAQVNKWVNDKTHGRVQKLFSSIGPNVHSVLLNAIYLKGLWAKRFDPALTEQAQFFVSATKTVPVQMMSMQARFRAEWFSNLDAKVIELPLKKSDLVMIIYLPNKVGDLDVVEARITDSTRPKKRQFVNLKLPKFRISSKAKLKPVLKHFGIKTLFKRSANLSGIVGSEASNFYVDNVIQEAFIEINEDGGEVAAVTDQLYFLVLSVEPRTSPLDFIVNVPFAYSIRDEREVYFQGHVNQPVW
ncbi:hypothetical protein KR059_005749, partial [Drosophila kikkawai]